MSLTYNPKIFDVADEQSARRIILTTEGGVGTDERWAKETPYLADLICEQLALQPGQVVLDYGCGIGRMAKALIERVGCHVLGVDISTDMRGLAPGHVSSALFSVVSRRMFEGLVAKGLRVDAAISVWVLQHCLTPSEDIALIRSGLGASGKVLVINNNGRAVPTVEQSWADDRLDIRQCLAAQFVEQETGQLEARHVGQLIAQHAFWATYSQHPTP